MKQSSKTLRKMLAVALAVATIGSAGILTEVGTFVGTNLTAEAANYELHTYNDITYALYSDGTAEAVSYSGSNKDFSTTTFAMPSVIYSKNLGKDYILDRSQFTVTRMQADGFSGIKARIFSLPNSLQVLFGGFRNTEIGSFVIATNNAYFSLSSSAGGILLNKSGTEIIAYPSKPSLYWDQDFIYIPSTITSIGMYAFTSYKATSITIPSTVTYVGRGAFQYSSLYSITFAGSPSFWCANTDEIGTFDDATNLDSITINGTSGKYSTYNGAIYNKDQTVLMYCPEGRTTSSAFAISSKATKIGNYAFRNCKKLTAICIPETITSIGEYEVFYNTNKNLVLYVTQDSYGLTYAKNNNMAYKVIYSYTKKSDNTLKITGYDGPWNSFTIPSKINGYTVSEIGAEAFKGKTNITSVSIPSTVTAIGNYAFYGMSKLEKISIPSKVTTIGQYTFGHCKTLTSVTIPNNVTSIGYCAFYSCSNLASLSIGSGVTTIGGSAFCNTALTSQYIPKTVTSVGSYAFGYKYADSAYTRDSAFTQISGYPNTAAQTYCKNYDVPFKSLLQYSTSSDGKSIKIEKYTGTDTVVVIPDKIDGLPVTSIAGYAFNGTNVTKITLPSGMTALDGYALYGASKLTTVVFPSGLTSIGQYAFEFCSSLKSITIPNTVTSIGNGAFYACNQLASVNLGTGVKTIGGYAFENTALTSVSIPKSVTSIGDYAFGDKWENSTHTMIDGFKITGYAYTAAETYANKYSITFNPLYEAITNNSTISKTAITLGDSVTINFASTGGKKPITYAAMYSLDGGSSVSICSYSTNTSTTFTPSKAGTYTIYTYAQDDRGQFIRKDFTLTVDTPAVKNTSTVWVGENQGATTMYADDSVGVAFAATGGNGSYKYSVFYHIKGSNYWYTAIENTTRTNISFRMTDDNGEALIGNCQILVTAKDTDGKFESKTFNMTVYNVIANTSEISAETAAVGDSLTINASAIGGAGNFTYAFSYKREDIGGYVTIGSSGDTCTFTPPIAGNYLVRVIATDSNGKSVGKVFEVTVYEKLVNTSVISATTIDTDSTVAVHASATGGNGAYKYNIQYYPEGYESWENWVSVALDTADTDFAFKLYDHNETLPGNYVVVVEAYDSNGSRDTKKFTVTVKENNTLQSTSRISIEGEVYLDDTITVYAGAKGGKTPYTYAVYYKKTSANSWTTVQGFKSNATVAFQFPEVADYDVCVKVKDADGTIVKDYYELSVIIDEERLVNESTISPETTAVGKKVTFTGKASGGTGDYQYAFLYKKASDNKWVNKQSFSANDTVSIKPEAAVDYDVCIKVKDSSGAVEKKYFTLHVNEALANTSAISSASIIKGQTVTVTAAGENGVAPYTYAVYYKKSTQSKWTTKQDFDKNNVVDVKPAGTGLYEVCVKVKDELGTISKVYFDVEVTAAAELSSNAKISATEIKKGESVTINADGVGGVAPYTYSVQYKQQSKSKWTTQQEFDANDTIVVTPASATAYDICVKVQDSTGTVAKQYFVVTVS